jgi:hypothetical protein
VQGFFGCAAALLLAASPSFASVADEGHSFHGGWVSTTPLAWQDGTAAPVQIEFFVGAVFLFGPRQGDVVGFEEGTFVVVDRSHATATLVWRGERLELSFETSAAETLRTTWGETPLEFASLAARTTDATDGTNAADATDAASTQTDTDSSDGTTTDDLPADGPAANAAAEQSLPPDRWDPANAPTPDDVAALSAGQQTTSDPQVVPPVNASAPETLPPSTASERPSLEPPSSLVGGAALAAAVGLLLLVLRWLTRART